MTNKEAKELQDKLMEEGLSLNFYKDTNSWPDEVKDIGDCDEWAVWNMGKKIETKNVRYYGKLPKKKKLDIRYFMDKIFKQDARQSINYSKLFNKLLNLEIAGSIYTTSYGFGIENIFNWNRDKNIKMIKDFLDKNGIEYKTEYSDAHWVYRFKISYKKENIKKLKQLIKNIY